MPVPKQLWWSSKPYNLTVKNAPPPPGHKPGATLAFFHNGKPAIYKHGSIYVKDKPQSPAPANAWATKY